MAWVGRDLKDHQAPTPQLQTGPPTNIVTTTSYAFSPAMNNSLHALLVKHVSVDAVTIAETPHPPPHCAHIPCLVSTNVQKCWWMSMGVIFSAWRNSVTQLCSLCTFMPDAILPDCPSAAICHTATKWKRIVAGRFSLYQHSPLMSWAKIIK